MTNARVSIAFPTKLIKSVHNSGIHHPNYKQHKRHTYLLSTGIPHYDDNQATFLHSLTRKSSDLICHIYTGRWQASCEQVKMGCNFYNSPGFDEGHWAGTFCPIEAGFKLIVFVAVAVINFLTNWQALTRHDDRRTGCTQGKQYFL